MSTTYAIPHRSFLLDGERRYELTIHDLPDEDRPREKLLATGPMALSSQELLAVLLSTGTKKENVLAMSERILKDYGEKAVLRQTDATALATDLDIPIGKAMQLVAAGELGRRFYSSHGVGAPTIRTAREVYDYAADMRTLPKEHLRGLYLNAHYKVIRDEVISIGTVDGSMVHPREVFRPALEYAAAAVILVHNHPSGEAAASSADMQVTKQLIDAGTLLGIELIDHVVVTKDGYTSVPAPYRS